jgi:hypothetical protein
MSMICEPCKTGRHEDCTLGDCACPERREQQAVERRLNAIRATDERLANLVYTTLLYGGSAEARILTDGAGRDTVRLFVCQIIGTLRSINC